MSRELLRRLREAIQRDDGRAVGIDTYNLLLEVDRELAKPEPQPVAIVEVKAAPSGVAP